MKSSYVIDNSIMGADCKVYERAQVKNCLLGNNVVVGEDSYINNSVLGDYVQINRRNQIDDIVIGKRSFTGSNTILRHAEIGNYTSISWNVSLGGGGRHHYDYLSSHPFAQLVKFGIVDHNEETEFPKTRFGNDVWVGMDTTIIAGVKIGDGAVIGAGSVVTKDVPPYAVAFGSPAIVRKMRFESPIIEKLLQICWWDWPDEAIKDSIDLFTRPLQLSDLDRLSRLYDEINQT